MKNLNLNLARNFLTGTLLLSLISCGDTNFIGGGSAGNKSSTPVNPGVSTTPGNNPNNTNTSTNTNPDGTIINPNNNEVVNPKDVIKKLFDTDFHFPGITFKFSDHGRYRIGNNDYPKGSCKAPNWFEDLFEPIASKTVKYPFTVREQAQISIGVSHCGSDAGQNTIALERTGGGSGGQLNSPVLELSERMIFFVEQVVARDLILPVGSYSLVVQSGATKAKDDIDDVILKDVQIGVRTGKVVISKPIQIK